MGKHKFITLNLWLPAPIGYSIPPLILLHFWIKLTFSLQTKNFKTSILFSTFPNSSPHTLICHLEIKSYWNGTFFSSTSSNPQTYLSVYLLSHYIPQKAPSLFKRELHQIYTGSHSVLLPLNQGQQTFIVEVQVVKHLGFVGHKFSFISTKVVVWNQPYTISNQVGMDV